MRSGAREPRGEGFVVCPAGPPGEQPDPAQAVAIMNAPTRNVTEQTRLDACLTSAELWRRYVELGGMSTSDEMESILRLEVEPTAHDHDVLAHALNERFTELGHNHPVRYSEGRFVGTTAQLPVPMENRS
ncbi:MAG TPA: hypothetical protein VGB52_03335 [Actinomycetota bacterium]